MIEFLFCEVPIVLQLLVFDFWFYSVPALCTTPQVSSVTLVPEYLRLFLSRSRTSTHPQSDVFVPMATPPRTCGHLGCYSRPNAAVGFGHTKWETQTFFWIWCLPKWFPIISTLMSVTSSPSLTSALLQVWRCLQTEAPAFRWLAGQTDSGRGGPLHLVQPCTQLVHQCDHACWAEPHRCPAALCQSPVS